MAEGSGTHSLDGNRGGARVNSTSKAIRILECFTPAQPELSLGQLSSLLHMPKSTLLNQLRTLTDANMLMRVQNGRAYCLGYKIMQLSYNARKSSSIAQYAIPIMEDLQVATGEIIYLTSYIDGKVFYMECLYPSHRSVSYSIAGKTLPMHCTGCGKAMLSYMDEREIRRIIDKNGLEGFTPHTITSRQALMKELAVTKARGYALDNEEETLGVRCVAAAIRDERANVAGALSISASVLSINEEVAETYAKMLLRACNMLSPYARLFPALMLENESCSREQQSGL